MGFGRLIRRITNTAGSALNALPGSKLGIYDIMLMGLGGTLRANAANKAAKSANAANAASQADLSQTKADLAEEARLKLIAQQSADAQAQAERTRTTFAGSSIQSLLERKKLLGS